MGYICHHGIMVTSWSPNQLKQAHEKALEIFTEETVSAAYSGNASSLVSPIFEGLTNGYASFAIFPDGSKEGWDLSDSVEAKRDEFIKWLNAQRFEDGSTYFDWALIQYGDDEGHNYMMRHESQDPAEVTGWP